MTGPLSLSFPGRPRQLPPPASNPPRCGPGLLAYTPCPKSLDLSGRQVHALGRRPLALLAVLPRRKHLGVPLDGLAELLVLRRQELLGRHVLQRHGGVLAPLLAVLARVPLDPPEIPLVRLGVRAEAADLRGRVGRRAGRRDPLPDRARSHIRRHRHAWGNPVPLLQFPAATHPPFLEQASGHRSNPQAGAPFLGASSHDAHRCHGAARSAVHRIPLRPCTRQPRAPHAPRTS